MTMKPRVKKFRVRRSPSTQAAPGSAPGSVSGAAPAPGSASGPVPGPTSRARPVPGQGGALHAPSPASGAATAARQLNPMEEAALEGHEDGFSSERFPTAPAAPEPAQADTAPTPEEELAAIRKEGLTGRQLRMARRVAAKHGLPATSDYDAVRLLRRAGIDPFQRSTMLELVSAEGGKPGDANARNLPQVVDGKEKLPSKEVLNAATRAKSIMEIQHDIAKRRRRKILLLFTRLAFFVLLPTLMAGYYYYKVATPMYATKSEFVIQTADGSGSGGLGSLFSGSGLATSQDSITVQSYLTSRDAMIRLDQEVGFKDHFSNPEIDPIQRLPEGASNEEAYRIYKRNVKIGYDPSEGIIKMEVIAADPATSALYSEALIRYAEERVDSLTQRKREDQMQGARESYAEAEAKMLEAQAEVLHLQEEMGVLDAGSEGAAIMGQINGFEVQLLEKQLQLAQLEANAQPNQARVEGVKGDIARLEAVIAELRAKLTSHSGENASLAVIQGKLAVAQTNMETRILLMQQALQQLETARIEANKQTRYLELGVSPVAPDEATYPRAFENTILAFLIFSGIYLMFSLTASILREQISG